MRGKEVHGIKFEGVHGPLNSIVDVKGLQVGHETIIKDAEGPLGENVHVRTGVSAILPIGRGGLGTDVFCGASVLNGNGELTGLSWMEESGMLSGPVMLTNTYSVGLVRDATLKWLARHDISTDSLPVVGEISDDYLNDISGHHVADFHVFSAIDKASGKGMEEGSIGAGTGAVCYEFKGGIGSSSRMVAMGGQEYTVGVMVLANHGLRHQFMVNGIPVGQHFRKDLVRTRETGSIVIVIATDAPLLPHQLKRLSRRAFLGLARTGSSSSDGSGDFALAFSVANRYVHGSPSKKRADWMPNAELDGLFESTAQATEESILNALFSAGAMEGRDGHRVSALPVEELKALMVKRQP